MATSVVAGSSEPRTVRFYFNESGTDYPAYNAVNTSNMQGQSYNFIGCFDYDFIVSKGETRYQRQSIPSDSRLDRFYVEYTLAPGTYQYAACDPDSGLNQNVAWLFAKKTGTFTVAPGSDTQVVEIGLDRKILHFTVADYNGFNEKVDGLNKLRKVVAYTPVYKKGTVTNVPTATGIAYTASVLTPDANGVYAVPVGYGLAADLGGSLLQPNLVAVDREGYEFSLNQAQLNFHFYTMAQSGTAYLGLSTTRDTNVRNALAETGMFPNSLGIRLGILNQARIAGNTADNPEELALSWWPKDTLQYTMSFYNEDIRGSNGNYGSVAEAIKGVSYTIGGDTAEFRNMENPQIYRPTQYIQYLPKSSAMTMNISVADGWRISLNNLSSYTYTTEKITGATVYKINIETSEWQEDYNAFQVEPDDGKGRISFQTNGGTTVEPVSVELEEPVPVSSLPQPMHLDNTFVGWYKDQGLQNLWTDADYLTATTVNTTLYAKWADNMQTGGGGNTIISVSPSMAATVTPAETSGTVGTMLSLTLGKIAEGYMLEELTSSYSANAVLEEGSDYVIKENADGSYRIDILIKPDMLSTDGANVIRLGIKMISAASELTAAISAAQNNLASVTVSPDGAQVDCRKFWVTQAQADAYSDAIDDGATALTGHPAAMPAALYALLDATGQFNGLKKGGLLVNVHYTVGSCDQVVKLEQSGDVANGDVQYQTADEVIAALPAKIAANLLDSAGNAAGSRDIPVTWTDTDHYDAAVGGSYTFTAAWTLPLDVANPNNIAAPTVKVTVLQTPDYATANRLLVWTGGPQGGDLGNVSGEYTKVLVENKDQDFGAEYRFKPLQFDYDIHSLTSYKWASKDTGAEICNGSGIGYSIQLEPGYTAKFQSAKNSKTVTVSESGSVYNMVLPGDTLTITVSPPAGSTKRPAVYRLNFDDLAVGYRLNFMGIRAGSQQTEDIAKSEFFYGTEPGTKTIEVPSDLAEVVLRQQEDSKKKLEFYLGGQKVTTADAQGNIHIPMNADAKNLEVTVKSYDYSDKEYTHTLLFTKECASRPTLDYFVVSRVSYYSTETENTVGAVLTPAAGRNDILVENSNSNSLYFIASSSNYRARIEINGQEQSSVPNQTLIRNNKIKVKVSNPYDDSLYTEYEFIVKPNGVTTDNLLSIDTQPDSGLLAEKGKYTAQDISIAASDEKGGGISYQWYRATAADKSDEVEIEGADTASLTVPAGLDVGLYYYYCRVSAAGAVAIDSDSYVLQVIDAPSLDGFSIYGKDWAGVIYNNSENPKAVDVEILNGTESVCVMASSALASEIKINNVPGTQISSGAYVWENINLSGGLVFQLEIAHAVKPELVASYTINLNQEEEVNPQLSILAQPQNQSLIQGNTATLGISALASSGVLTYQWYACDDVERSNPIPVEGATDKFFTTPLDLAVLAPHYYFCRVGVVDKPAVVLDSQAANIAVAYPAPTVTYDGSYVQSTYTVMNRAYTAEQSYQSKTVTFPIVEQTNFGADIFYQWYYQNADGNEMAIPGANEDSLTIGIDDYPLGQHKFYCVAKGTVQYENPAAAVDSTSLKGTTHTVVIEDTAVPTLENYRAAFDKISLLYTGRDVNGVYGVDKVVYGTDSSQALKYEYFVPNRDLWGRLQSMANNAGQYRNDYYHRATRDINRYYGIMLDVLAQMEPLMERGTKNSPPFRSGGTLVADTVTVGEPYKLVLFSNDADHKVAMFEDNDVRTGHDNNLLLCYKVSTTTSGGPYSDIDGSTYTITPVKTGTYNYYFKANDGENDSPTFLILELTVVGADKTVLTQAIADAEALISPVQPTETITQAAIDTYRNAIQAATLVKNNADVTAAVVAQALTDLHTAGDAFRALLNSDALGGIKAAAISELSGYKNLADYRTAQQLELTAAIQTGTAAIQNAAAVEDVQTALVAAKTTIDGIKTDAQLTAEENAAAEAARKAAAKAVDDKIAAIGTVTLERKGYIDVARDAYDALSSEEKALVENYVVLTAAETAYGQLQAAAENAAAEAALKEAAKIVDDKIAAIGTVTLERKRSIDAARIAYDDLSAAEKAYVTKLNVLTAAETAYEQLLAAAEEDAAEAVLKAAAKAVDDKIVAIGAVTLESKRNIDTARIAYDDLSSAEKAYVTKLNVLTAAETTYGQLQVAAEEDAAEAALKAAAKAVDDRIAAIGTVTLESKGYIDIARAAYENLEEAGKELVENLDALTAAEQAYDVLKADADQQATDLAAAKAVNDIIMAISEVTLEQKDAITDARAAYDALTSTQKEFVGKLAVLNAAEAAYQLLNSKAEAVKILDAEWAKYNEDDYNTASWTTLLRLRDEGKEKIDSAGTEGEVDGIVQSTISGLAAVAKKDVTDIGTIKDVNAGAWYYNDVAYVLANGIMKGTAADRFEPEGVITRGQFVTILGRTAGIADSAAGKPVKTPFADVSENSYYAAHVQWASENGITNGTSTTAFEPEATITRQDLAVMMARYAKATGISLPDGAGAVKFADNGKIAAYAADAVYSLTEAGILGGVGNNTFEPAATATRAQAAKIIHLLLER